MSQQQQTDVFLKHYGVKGMKWGVRKATIKAARKNVRSHERKLDTAEQEYLKAKQSGKKKATDKALANLNATYKDRQRNLLTAHTLTRGEQLAVGVLGSIGLTPMIAGAALAGNKIATRDSQRIGNYPVKMLKNLDPDPEV